MLPKSLVFAVLMSAFALPSFAQKDKMKVAIETLNSTEFIRKYKDYHETIQATVAQFKTVATDFPTEDVREVQYAYQSTRQNFDKILETLKKDLMDKQNRKFISNNPDRYTQFVSQELDLAFKNYQKTVQEKIGEITGEEIVGLGPEQIKLILNFLFDVIGVIRTIEDELAKMNEQYIEENFIAPLRLKAWEKL